MHICKEYLDGVGHIELVDGVYRASFYGRRVKQSEHATLQEARAALRRLAR